MPNYAPPDSTDEYSTTAGSVSVDRSLSTDSSPINWTPAPSFAKSNDVSDFLLGVVMVFVFLLVAAGVFVGLGYSSD